jgi:DNA-binding MarR family transcriptional regulator
VRASQYDCRMPKKAAHPAWTDTPALSSRVVNAIARVASAMRTAAWQFGTAEGLNPAQLEILEMLAARRDGVRVSWIAEQLGVTSASASDSVSAVVDKGLVTKGRASHDARVTEVMLTPAGRRVVARLRDAMAFASEAVDALPGASQDALYSSLLALIGRLQSAQRFPDIRACASCQHFAVNVRPGAVAAHQCRLLDAPLSTSLLRLDCAEHERAEPPTIRRNWLSLERA